MIKVKYIPICYKDIFSSAEIMSFLLSFSYKYQLIGVTLVTFDLSGYYTGNMNKTLDEEQKYGYGQPT